VVREDRSVLDLLTADYSFVNERVAGHYGIPNVTGNAFRRVQVPDYRRGLLGHGSVLVLTSVADRTSPVMRGKWVVEVLLGSPPPPPPPRGPAERAAEAPGRLSADVHGKPDDVRARTPGGVLRHADRPRDRTRGCEARPPHVRVRARHREQCGVPHVWSLG